MLHMGKLYHRVAIAMTVILAIAYCRKIYMYNTFNVHISEQIGVRQQDVDPDTYKRPQTPYDLQNAHHEDPRLIKHIRDHWLIAPSDAGERNVNVTDRQKHSNFSEFGQPSCIVINNRTEGFFVECGAADGELKSNNLYLEMDYSWTGLLVEANPIYFRSLLRKRRRHFLINTCLSPSDRAMRFNFTTTGIAGGSLDTMPLTGQESQLERGLYAILTPIMLQCFPLCSILQAAGVSHVDYLSLDVEGAEIQILKSLPFRHVSIDAMTVETRVVNDKEASIRKEEQLVNMMSQHGYQNVTRLSLDVVLLQQDNLDK